MKVTLVNTSDAGGGAPVATMRLLNALTETNIDAQFLVQKKQTNEVRVHAIEKNFFSRLKSKLNFLLERLPFIFFYAKEKSMRFAFSTANVGVNIDSNPYIQNTDIIHLHWINSGFLSINNLKKLFNVDKPIVWTLHDMWTFTGGCHYAGDCNHFTANCGDCYFLKSPNKNDLSHVGWLKKFDLYKNQKNITFITCSNWLARVAKESSILKNFRVEVIPNPIDTNLFTPKDRIDTRKKWNIKLDTKIILFGAANINDRRKGIKYLVEALHILKKEYPAITPIEIVIFGKNKDFDVSEIPFPVYELNIITAQQDLVEIYSLADVYVLPSIEDNLPNTVMESLACGTPVVAFNTGGLPDMIDHNLNGYLADFKSADDFAKGINEVINSPEKEQLNVNSRNKVLNNFTNQIVAEKYINLYKSIL